jgi:hypothetical protein
MKGLALGLLALAPLQNTAHAQDVVIPWSLRSPARILYT